MKSKLLIVGGVIQVLILALHIAIFFGTASATDLSTKTKESIHIFNAAVTVTVMFFAYVSLMRRQDLLGSSLGRIVSCFIAVFYLQRGLVDAYLHGIAPVIFTLCMVVAAIYFYAALPKAGESSSPAAT